MARARAGGAAILDVRVVARLAGARSSIAALVAIRAVAAGATRGGLALDLGGVGRGNRNVATTVGRAASAAAGILAVVSTAVAVLGLAGANVGGPGVLAADASGGDAGARAGFAASTRSIQMHGRKIERDMSCDIGVCRLPGGTIAGGGHGDDEEELEPAVMSVYAKWE